MKEYDVNRIEYLYKRLDTLHKSIVRKASIFTIIVVNIYFAKLWDPFVSLFAGFAVLLGNFIREIFLISNPPPYIYNISQGLAGATQELFLLVSPMLPIFFTSIILVIGIYFITFEYPDIWKINQELKKYDRYYNVKVSDMNKSWGFKQLQFLVNKFLIQTYQEENNKVKY